jgi:beta-lactamase superfamily II metal-dependent hydrolase
MRLLKIALVGVVVALSVPLAQSREELKIYVIDVEGGGASLFVAPSGETLLVDPGNGDAAASRDAGRILDAASDGGVKQIDHLVTTHYHGDHVGGLAELASRIPIKHFIDHGPTVEPQNPAAKVLARYGELANQARHTVAKPGDAIQIAGLDVRVVTAAGKVIQAPMSGAGQPNAACAGVKPIDPDPTENAQSVGMSIVFGRFRVAHLGDLTWNGELELMCPNNRFGTADLFLVSHHAQQFERAMSNSPALVHGLHPRVAISTNGIRKGAQVAAMKVLFTSPGLEDLWQLHASEFSGQEYTVPGAFIANELDEPLRAMPIGPMPTPSPGQQVPPAPTHNGPAHFIKVVALRDGTFTVTNTRNGFSKTYQK